jgi:hypothetical protein
VQLNAIGINTPNRWPDMSVQISGNAVPSFGLMLRCKMKGGRRGVSCSHDHAIQLLLSMPLCFTRVTASCTPC